MKQISAQVQFVTKLKAIKSGWGGRDRTYECRNQNPVPYHLATPQNIYSII